MSSVQSNNFDACLYRLGGLTTPKSKEKIFYVDLEEFFLQATLEVFNNDSRLSRCIEFWVYRYGKYLSPFKLVKLIKNENSFDPSALGGLLSIADNKFPRGQFSTLQKYAKKSPGRKMFNIVSALKKTDHRWEKYGIEAPIFLLDEEAHFLRGMSGVILNIPELKYRVMGLTPSASDLKAYLEVFPDSSLYRAAKETHQGYGSAHKNYTRYVLPFLNIKKAT